MRCDHDKSRLYICLYDADNFTLKWFSERVLASHVAIGTSKFNSIYNTYIFTENDKKYYFTQELNNSFRHIEIGLFQFISAPPCRGTGKLHGGRAFFSKWKIPGREAFLDWKFQGGDLKYLQNYKILEIPWEGVNSAGNSMGGR